MTMTLPLVDFDQLCHPIDCGPFVSQTDAALDVQLEVQDCLVSVGVHKALLANQMFADPWDVLRDLLQHAHEQHCPPGTSRFEVAAEGIGQVVVRLFADPEFGGAIAVVHGLDDQATRDLLVRAEVKPA